MNDWNKWNDGLDEWEDIPEEDNEPLDAPEEILDVAFTEEIRIDNPDIPDEWWAKDIKDIQCPEDQQREIEQAQNEVRLEERLDKKLEKGEITEKKYQDELTFSIRPRQSKISTRSGLESVGLSYDKIGDITEDYDFILTDLALGGDLSDKKERLKQAIHDMGPEAARDLADRMLSEGSISREAFDVINRQIRLHEK